MLKLAVRHKVFDTQPRSQCASVAGLGKKWFLRLPPPTYAPYENWNGNHTNVCFTLFKKKNLKASMKENNRCVILSILGYGTHLLQKLAMSVNEHPAPHTLPCRSCSCILPSQAWTSCCCGPCPPHLLVVHHIAWGISFFFLLLGCISVEDSFPVEYQIRPAPGGQGKAPTTCPCPFPPAAGAPGYSGRI